MPGALRNPFYDGEPALSARDPAVCYHDGLYRCYHSAVETLQGRIHLFLDEITSPDLQAWSAPRRLLSSPLNFSSPGNVLRVGDRFVLCLQSYPIAEGEQFGGSESRLWTMESRDLFEFSPPTVMAPEGSTARWAKGPRQIDPYLVERDGVYYVLYKANGCLGLLRSEDLRHFTEASPDRPILSPEDTPDGATVENPCVIWEGGRYLLFFAPCREGRGIGVAESSDLLRWRKVRYLDFPALPWALGGPTAPMVLDDRARTGKWLMFFHGDRAYPHGAALGLAVSDDLERWTAP